jgi:hypothetical protein
MREELLGIEDSFKFASQVLEKYARALSEEKDHSVELYLLNHWVRDFSLRDIIDRVAVASGDGKLFSHLFTWMFNNKLTGEWGAIEDFRKLALLMAKNLRVIEVTDFFTQAVDKSGAGKVRDFMEM